MNNPIKFHTPYISRVNREIEEKKPNECRLTPFKAQSIVFEILKNHLIVNKPSDIGFPFSETYDPDITKTKIFIDMSNNWKACTTQMRPAVYIYRGEANYTPSGKQTIGGNTIGRNPAESEESFMRTVSMPIMLNCIHAPIGAIETFVDYIKYPFLYFSKHIAEEYCFTKFRLVSISAPEQNLTDAKDAFSVKITIDTEFIDTWITKGDHLKLKTVQFSMYNDVTEKPLELQ